MMKPPKKTPAKKTISPPTRKRRIAARAAPAAAKALRDRPTGRSQGAQPGRHVTRLPAAAKALRDRQVAVKKPRGSAKTKGAL